MYTTEQIAFVKTRVEAATGIQLPFDISVATYTNGVCIRLNGNHAEIDADGINSLARGFFVLSRAVKENVKEGSWTQHRHFTSCGTMVDMSRNAVMKVEAVI